MILAYRSDYYPPIPEFHIALTIPLENKWTEPFPIFVDSGADMTIIPEFLLRSLRLPAERNLRVRSQWRSGPVVNVYRVDIRIEGLVFPSVEIAGDPVGEDAVLGRDILNLLDIRLNGPARQLHLLTR